MSPADIKAWLLPGFTGASLATHHTITNHRIDVDGDRATIRAHIHAEHWIDPAEAGDGPQCWVRRRVLRRRSGPNRRWLAHQFGAGHPDPLDRDRSRAHRQRCRGAHPGCRSGRSWFVTDRLGLSAPALWQQPQPRRFAARYFDAPNDAKIRFRSAPGNGPHRVPHIAQRKNQRTSPTARYAPLTSHLVTTLHARSAAANMMTRWWLGGVLSSGGASERSSRPRWVQHDERGDGRARWRRCQGHPRVGWSAGTGSWPVRTRAETRSSRSGGGSPTRRAAGCGLSFATCWPTTSELSLVTARGRRGDRHLAERQIARNDRKSKITEAATSCAGSDRVRRILGGLTRLVIRPGGRLDRSTLTAQRVGTRSS